MVKEKQPGIRGLNTAGHASRDQIIIRYEASQLLAGLKPAERERHDDGEMESYRCATDENEA